MLKNTIIYLIGFSGTGKLTVAKAINKINPSVIVDNQLINDPIFSVIETDGKSSIPLGVWLQAAKIRNAVFETVKHYGKSQSNFIFTNELFEKNDGDNKIYHAVKEIAETRESLFVPVTLNCEKNVLLERIEGADRKEKRKCTNSESAAKNIDFYKILKPDHSNALILDITFTSAEETAKIITTHCLQCSK